MGLFSFSFETKSLFVVLAILVLFVDQAGPKPIETYLTALSARIKDQQLI